MDRGAWKAAVHWVAEGRTRLSGFTFTSHFHASEKEMTTHSSVLAWRIPRMVEPGGLLSMRSHRVRRDWSDLAANLYRLYEWYMRLRIEGKLSTAKVLMRSRAWIVEAALEWSFTFFSNMEEGKENNHGVWAGIYRYDTGKAESWGNKYFINNIKSITKWKACLNIY